MSNGIDIVIFPNAEEATGHGFNYNEWDKPPSACKPVKAVIVQSGTEGGRPTVDFISEDAAGNKHVFMITGRLLASIVELAFHKPK